MKKYQIIISAMIIAAAIIIAGYTIADGVRDAFDGIGSQIASAILSLG